MSANASYSTLAPYYDLVVGDRSDETERIERVIQEYQPDATSILELGCGTGAVLEPFSDRYAIYGIDLSEAMLLQARKNIPNGTFIHGDIRTTQIGENVDVILSMYDTFNHLLSLDDWQATFENAKSQLNKGGLLFFDMNTKYRLVTLSEQSPFLHETSWGSWTFNVTHTGDSRYQFDITVRFPDGTEAHETIQEYTPSLESITTTLEDLFKFVKIMDAHGNTDTIETAPKAYLACQ